MRATPVTCPICGVTLPTLRGYRIHQPSHRPSIAERFWAKVAKTDGCWEWTGSRRTNGYGQFVVVHNQAEGQRIVTAHRFAWELAAGPIPDGLFVCHHCDNRLCVRTDHLFLGTHADNMADMVAKGRQSRRGAA